MRKGETEGEEVDAPTCRHGVQNEDERDEMIEANLREGIRWAGSWQGCLAVRGNRIHISGVIVQVRLKSGLCVY